MHMKRGTHRRLFAHHQLREIFVYQLHDNRRAITNYLGTGSWIIDKVINGRERNSVTAIDKAAINNSTQDVCLSGLEELNVIR